MKAWIGAVALITTQVVPAWAASVEDVATTKELASAANQYMITTYGCQNHLGGLAQYRAAKLTVEMIFIKLGVDRNQAVLMIQQAEDNIQATSPQVQMETMRKQEGITSEDAQNGCYESVAQAQDRIKLLQAKLKLL